MRKRKPAIERFMGKIEKTDDCWIWKGSINNVGYGEFRGDNQRQITAHRWSYVWHKGEIPSKHDVKHSCDNKKCVNPLHLSVGTHKENIYEALERGRIKAKISFEQANLIRILVLFGLKQKDVAKIFSITPQYVNMIIMGVTRNLTKR